MLRDGRVDLRREGAGGVGCENAKEVVGVPRCDWAVGVGSNIRIEVLGGFLANLAEFEILAGVQGKSNTLRGFLPPGVFKGRGIEPRFLPWAILLTVLARQMPYRTAKVVSSNLGRRGVGVRYDQKTLPGQDGTANPLAAFPVVVFPPNLAVRVTVRIAANLQCRVDNLDGSLSNKVASFCSIGVKGEGVLPLHNEKNIEAFFSSAATFSQHAVFPRAVEKLGAIGNVFVKVPGEAIEVLVFFWIKEIGGKGRSGLTVGSKVKALRNFSFEGT